MSVTGDHQHYMRRALELAKTVPARPFGTVIVDQEAGEIVAEGWNQSSLNPTWHAEIDAINHLVQQPRDWNGQQLVLYTTAEPCPMCQGAILWTGIGTVVFGTSIRVLQRLGWKQMDLRAAELVRRSPAFPCQVIGGVLEEECNALFSAANGKQKP